MATSGLKRIFLLTLLATIIAIGLFLLIMQTNAPIIGRSINWQLFSMPRLQQTVPTTTIATPILTTKTTKKTTKATTKTSTTKKLKSPKTTKSTTGHQYSQAFFDFIRRQISPPSSSSPSSCPLLPPRLLLVKPISIVHDDSKPTWTQLSSLLPNVTDGGGSPKWCRQSERLAVLVAYRNRESHLRRLLLHLHWLLPLQAADYRIFVIEQSGIETFNRGAVFNAGFKEVMKRFNATCLVLHDVDMVPEVPINLYRCGKNPRLLSSGLNKFKYKLPYGGYFGGTVAILTKQFELINGFSNLFWGWGGEDDNLKQRLHWKSIVTVATPENLGRYHMVKHNIDGGNEVNPERFKILRRNRKIWEKDGLNNVEYTAKISTCLPLFCHIRVRLKGPKMKKQIEYPLLKVV